MDQMSFSVPERLLLLSLLMSAEGNRTTLRIVTDLLDELGFSEEEHAQLCFRERDGKTFWNDVVEEKQVTIGAVALSASIQTFTRLDELEKLPITALPLDERLRKEVAKRAENDQAAEAPTLKAV